MPEALPARDGGYILAVDPGTTRSGIALIDPGDYKPLAAAKIPNIEVYDWLDRKDVGMAVFEMVASYGMRVGREVFETCVWIGRFEEHATLGGLRWDCVYRQEEKMAICHSPNANDASIRRALVDRFCPMGTPNHGKGTKANPGWFYGFKEDAWQAYAVGVTWLDKQQMERRVRQMEEKDGDGNGVR